MLSYELSDPIIKRLKNISELAQRTRTKLDQFGKDTKEAVARYARISNIGSSTRIENAVLTDPAVEWLDEHLAQDARPSAFLKEKKYIQDKLSKEKERSIEEVAGCRNMLAIVYQQGPELFPLAPATLKGLHQELLQFYPPAAPYIGKYKIAPNNVVETILGTNLRKDVLLTADPGPLTEAAMRDLIDWYNDTLPQSPWAIAVAVEFVFRFLAIHPFQDGNGRLGRALFALTLLQSDDQNLKILIPYLAIDPHIERSKEEYYFVLRQCSDGRFSQDPKQYKIEFFLRYMLKQMEQSLHNDIDYYAKRYQSFLNLAPSPRAVLDSFRERPETTLALKDVMQWVKIPRRTVIHSLNLLLREGFLQKSGKGPAARYRLTF